MRNPTSFALFIPYLMIKNNSPISTPIVAIDTLLNIAMESCVFPQNRRIHETVLYRVVMYIFDMPDKVEVVSDLMFSIAMLPMTSHLFGLIPLLVPSGP
jgi:hypothetical protein